VPRAHRMDDTGPRLSGIHQHCAVIDDSAPPFELARQARLQGTERALARRLARGELVRIRPGVYLAAEVWQSYDFDARYRARVFAAAEVTRAATVFSHDAAAALLRLPGLGPWPKRVNVLGPAASGGRSSPGIHRLSGPEDPEAIRINQFAVTSLARTVIDVSARSDFTRAVCMIDAALRPAQKHDFRHLHGLPATDTARICELMASLAPFPGLARAKLAIQFGDGRSGSIGESISRVQMHLLGFPAPILQAPFYDSEGLIGYSDFYWPEFGLIGEFDGRVKYGDAYYARGHLPEEVVWAEKLREDRLRRQVRSLARWDWQVANSQRLLSERLRSHGLPRAA
jgi:hypothetical protein